MRRIHLAVLAAATLAGCDDPLFYAKVDAESVAITQTVQGVPGLPASDVPEATLTGVPFRVGDVVVSEVSDRSRLTLNAATLTLRSPGPDTTFAGIRSAQLRVMGPAGRGLATQAVASYDRARDGAAGATLVLRGSDVDLLPYLEAGLLRVEISAGGVPPGPPGTSWAFDFRLDFHVLGRVGWP